MTDLEVLDRNLRSVLAGASLSSVVVILQACEDELVARALPGATEIKRARVAIAAYACGVDEARTRRRSRPAAPIYSSDCGTTVK